MYFLLLEINPCSLCCDSSVFRHRLCQERDTIFRCESDGCKMRLQVKAVYEWPTQQCLNSLVVLHCVRTDWPIDISCPGPEAHSTCNISCTQCYMKTRQQKVCRLSMLPSNLRSKPSLWETAVLVPTARTTSAVALSLVNACLSLTGMFRYFRYNLEMAERASVSLWCRLSKNVGRLIRREGTVFTCPIVTNKIVSIVTVGTATWHVGRSCKGNGPCFDSSRAVWVQSVVF